MMLDESLRHIVDYIFRKCKLAPSGLRLYLIAFRSVHHAQTTNRLTSTVPQIDIGNCSFIMDHMQNRAMTMTMMMLSWGRAALSHRFKQ